MPKRGFTSPIGIYTTAEKNYGETLTETLLRHNVIALDDQLNPILKRTVEDIGEVTTLNTAPEFATPLQESFSILYPGSQVQFDSSFELQPKVLDSKDDDLSYTTFIKEEGASDYKLRDLTEWIHQGTGSGKATAPRT